MYQTHPPKWCLDAIPTSAGWRHPKTNELLVSVRLDVSLFDEKDVADEQSDATDQTQETPPLDTSEEQPKMKKRGRPSAK